MKRKSMDFVSRLRSTGGYFDAAALDNVSLAECADEIERLCKALELVQNFPSHPGGHAGDQSEQADDPASWRHGWLCAVAAIQETAALKVMDD